MAAFVTFREIDFYNDEEYIEGAWVDFNTPRAVMKLLQKQVISSGHPAAIYWEKISAKVRKCLKKLNDQYVTRFEGLIMEAGFPYTEYRQRCLYLPPYYKAPEGKINLLSLFTARPKSSRSQSTASPSKNGKGSPPDPERPVSIGFSVYQITPAAPPFAI